MRSEFTEFSYGFSITLEIVSAIRKRYPHYTAVAPEFPSLIDEGAGKGYDVAVSNPSKPFFIQFKLSEYLKGAKAKGRQLGKFSGPYFRFDLRELPSTQHSDLVNLEHKGELVYYAAPKFYEIGTFNAHFTASTIFQNSIIISPKKVLANPDGKKHQFCFDLSGNQHLFSDPREIEGNLDVDHFFKDIVERRNNLRGERDYSEVFLAILEAAGLTTDSPIAQALIGDGEDFILASARAARHLLGTTMFVLAQDEASDQN